MNGVSSFFLYCSKSKKV